MQRLVLYLPAASPLVLAVDLAELDFAPVLQPAFANTEVSFASLLMGDAVMKSPAADAGAAAADEICFSFV